LRRQSQRRKVHSFDLSRAASLCSAQLTRGCDRFLPSVIIFPPCCQGGRIVNLYGPQISGRPSAHQFLPGSKGGFVRLGIGFASFPRWILVEGHVRFRRVLWQDGFSPAPTCFCGQPIPMRNSFKQLCDRPAHRLSHLRCRPPTGSGQKASQQLAQRLCAQGIATRRVLCPMATIQTPSSPRAV